MNRTFASSEVKLGFTYFTAKLRYFLVIFDKCLKIFELLVA